MEWNISGLGHTECRLAPTHMHRSVYGSVDLPSIISYYIRDSGETQRLDCDAHLVIVHNKITGHRAQVNGHNYISVIRASLWRYTARREGRYGTLQCKSMRAPQCLDVGWLWRSKKPSQSLRGVPLLIPARVACYSVIRHPSSVTTR